MLCRVYNGIYYTAWEMGNTIQGLKCITPVLRVNDVLCHTIQGVHCSIFFRVNIEFYQIGCKVQFTSQSVQWSTREYTGWCTINGVNGRISTRVCSGVYHTGCEVLQIIQGVHSSILLLVYNTGCAVQYTIQCVQFRTLYIV